MAKTRQGQTSRPRPPSTLPHCAQPSSAALRRSTFARVGVYRRLCEGSWAAAGGLRAPRRLSWSCRGLQRKLRK
eukprot:11856283-Alexandrium_andersonii.AAC.1